MKNYDEMAQSIFARGNQIRKQRRKTRNVIAAAVSGVLVGCLAILVALGIWGQSPDPNTPADPLNYGTIRFLTAADMTNPNVHGQALQYVAGTAAPLASEAPPVFRFDLGGIQVVSKAVEEYPEEYHTLQEYGGTQITTYRLFRMQVLDPLGSGLAGEFLYALPARLKGDLTQYDALLISMDQLPENYVLRCGDELVAFEILFADAIGIPELGNIVAFTDGAFDESLWQEESWAYGYQFVRHRLEQNDEYLVVFRDATLEEALQRREMLKDIMYDDYKDLEVKVNHFLTAAAQEAMNYIKPFANGVFIPMGDHHNYISYRYINGCPTNEWISINYQDEAVTYSPQHFTNEDFENIPDLSQYIASLDLSQIAPPHTDPAGKKMTYNYAMGWYEKTDSGVYSIVKIAWKHFETWQDGVESGALEYYDEMFILIDGTGDHLISRGDLMELIGQNRNISSLPYGEGQIMPLE